jgi:MoaA/NifB/PqqE/SkfB family radical SAM enzyme
MPSSRGLVSIQIDASLHCQLACPLCPTADGRVRPALGAGHLNVAQFESLLERNREIAHVELSNYGEMFLNPELPEILACAFERKVTVSGSNGANLNYASEAALEAVVRYRVRALTCSIDGTTQETYSRYRVNGNLEKVLAHIDAIRELRAQRRSAFPLLCWQFVVFGHNEHEIRTAREMAAERGMEFIPRLSWETDYSPVRDRDLVRIESGTDAASRSEYLERHGRPYTRHLCLQLWHKPVLNWNGATLGCCVNYWGDFGVNGFTATLSEVMASPRLEYARRMLTGEAEPLPEIPCTTCGQYIEIRNSRQWLTPDEIRQDRGIGYIAGILLLTDSPVRFAQIAIAAGPQNQARCQPTGRLFRFGVDRAVYFRPSEPGVYTVSVRVLGSLGWTPDTTFQIEIAPRPICQEFTFVLPERTVPPRNSRHAAMVESLPLWIR